MLWSHCEKRNRKCMRNELDSVSGWHMLCLVGLLPSVWSVLNCCHRDHSKPGLLTSQRTGCRDLVYAMLRRYSASFHFSFSWNNSLLWGRCLFIKNNWCAGRDAINRTRVWPNIWEMSRCRRAILSDKPIHWINSARFIYFHLCLHSISLGRCFFFSLDLSFSLHLSFLI